MYARETLWFDPGLNDEDGTTWVMRGVAVDEFGPLCQVKAMAMHCYGKADGIPEDDIPGFTRDSAGNFLAGCAATA